MNGSHGDDAETAALSGSRRLLWLLAALAMLLFLGKEAFHEDEAGLALLVRNALENGIFSWPPIDGTIRSGCPPLLAYCVAWPSLICGEVNEALLRLPATFAALAGLGGLFYLSRKLYDRRTAYVSSYLLLGSFGFLFWSRFASAEILFMAATVWAVAFLAGRPDGNFGTYLVFYLIAMPAGYLKGLPGLLLPLVIAMFMLRPGRKGRLFHLAAFFAATLIAAAVYLLPWLRNFSGDYAGIGRRMIDDHLLNFAAGLHQSAPAIRFPLEFLRLASPWLLFNLAALAAFVAVRKNLRDSTVKLLLGFLAGCVLLFLCGARRWDHLLPLLPFLLLLTAAAADNKAARRYFRPVEQFMRLFVIFTASLATVSIFLLPFWQRLFQFSPPVLFLIGLPVFGVAALGIMIYDENRRESLARLSGLPESLAAILIGGTLLSIGVFSCLVPAWDELLPIRNFIETVPDNLSDIQENNYVFYQRGPTDRMLYYLKRARTAITTVSGPAELEAFAAARPDEKIAVFLNSGDGEGIDMPEILARSNLPVGRRQPDFREGFWKFENRENRKLKIWIVDLSTGKGNSG